jgi:hypothetical protein
MYQASVPVLLHGLTSLQNIIGKAQAHAAEKQIEPAALTSARLFPDMFPLYRQIYVATNMARNCAARLAGGEPPEAADNETTFDELRARIQKTIDYLQTFKPAQIDGSEERRVVHRMRNESVEFSGLDYLQYFVLPNFYFHITTTYNILRHNGVELGKRDFLGNR